VKDLTQLRTLHGILGQPTGPQVDVVHIRVG
jgi:hypothetical protein